MSTSFDVDVEAAVVRVSGEVDLATATALRECIEQVRTAKGERAVVIDLESVTFIDSTGLKELVRPAVEGCPVTLRSPSESTRQVLRLAGMADLFTVVEG